MTTYLSHDPFTRQSVVRERAKGECTWCGTPAKYRYGTEDDGVYTRINWSKGQFCNLKCWHSYHCA